jgi:hypothetical protein
LGAVYGFPATVDRPGPARVKEVLSKSLPGPKEKTRFRLGTVQGVAAARNRAAWKGSLWAQSVQCRAPAPGKLASPGWDEWPLTELH